ncbi:pyruvate kinase [Entomospira culicis]|uniref:Pyruvate kinase n=1 Tax=Entomospira culicis TaxID=2719989 RepID=A0A968GE34_9SPIO|nr:pyruvate kinase [Entomospira culicis]NIZ18676.1 pyruvate kinase [Entomospira culicis]NIZ68891.1 pyruvate kinase [Entomospira culicis]WDI37484.1 pyruvate kinase [Entomospira culicis]WDI39112.1 pyruvate kinase [Entomospira culicis]
MKKRTKIIATIGPASEDPIVLREMIRAGMNVARLNFSHGSYDEHAARIKTIREIAQEERRNVAILLDTKGPEIRMGRFNEKITLEAGQEFTLHVEEIMGDQHNSSVSFKELPLYVQTGDRILANDGLVAFRVVDVDKKAGKINCRVENGGTVGDRKNMNVPGVSIPMPFLAPKDIGDLEFGVNNHVDYVAASFTRTAQDIIELRELLKKFGDGNIKIIAKIENHEGMDNFEEILKVVDGVMVARGDLGVEIPLETVPIAQRTMIEACRKAGKIVITATQMLDSMIVNPRPTRAEVSDVASAVMQGVSAVMLSGESAAGKYPIESVAMMAKVAKTTEAATNYWDEFFDNRDKMNREDPMLTSKSIARAACDVAAILDATAIIVHTESGHSARAVARWRPGCPIIAQTPSEQVVRQLSLVWGVEGFVSDLGEDKELKETLEYSIERAKSLGHIKDGDMIVFTCGVPMSKTASTNLLKAHRVGDPII